ncbi:MAG: hypothetical protein JNL53_04805, partial [Cyclobacteriaceae bacterium]|nr:hypothetical protein [Cyclobacteriaceae bacterium]
RPRVPKLEKYACIEEEIDQLTEYWNAWEVEQSSVARKQVSAPKMK